MKNTVNTGTAGAIELNRRGFLVGTAGLVGLALAGCTKEPISESQKPEQLDILRNGIQARIAVLYLSLHLAKTPSEWNDANIPETREAIKKMQISGQDGVYTFIFHYTTNPKYMEIFQGTGRKDSEFYLRFDEDGKFDGHNGPGELFRLSEQLSKIPIYGV